MSLWKLTIFLLTYASFLLTVHSLEIISYKDYTSLVFSDNTGLVAAYGDWDGNRKPDIFLMEEGNGIKVVAAETGKPFQKTERFSTATLISNHSKTLFESVVPADYDGDAAMDLLCVHKVGDKYGMMIFWGDQSFSQLTEEPTLLSVQFLDQPFIYDVNGDMLPEIVGETEAGTRVTLTYTSRANFSVTTQSGLPPLYSPHGHAFIDMNGDLAADMVLMVKTDKAYELHVHTNTRGTFEKTKTIALPDGEFAVLGCPSYIDFDADGEMDVLLAVCEDKSCDKSILYVHSKQKWNVVLRTGDLPFSLVTPQLSQRPLTQLTLRTADVDLDGYPDVIVTVNLDGDGAGLRCGLLLHNRACSGCDYSRALHVLLDQPLGQNVVYSSFFDIGQDGSTDVLLTHESDGRFYVSALFLSTPPAYFLDVTVTSGTCSDDCPHDRTPFGMNAHGPTIRIQFTQQDGSQFKSIAGQKPQSGYFSLQSSDVTFGLAQTPNFVDSMVVGIPNSDSKGSRQRKWEFIIPNSALFVIPHPHDNPSQWDEKLFVQPSKNVVYTGAVLGALCALLAIVVAILHYREWKADEDEKKQESHKFHFDAM